METETSISWFESEDLYCSIPIPKAPAPTMEEMKQSEAEWVERMGSRKVRWLVVVDPKGKSSKESRDYMGKILPKYISAMALVCTSALARMAATLFFHLKPQPFPAKMFSNAQDARQWLEQL